MRDDLSKDRVLLLTHTAHSVKGVAAWPEYNAAGGYGKTFYLHPNATGPMPDTYRLAGTSFMASVAQDQFGR